ncbi:MAG: glycosyltransferase family 2 protein [Candidatus Woesebacteria bacterium]|jgi:dolichol-phosphate mannosyltransferase
MKKATVIIPTYNERGNIEKTTQALQAVFKKIKNWQMNMLVVDDSSPDKTYELVKELQIEQKNLHLLLNKEKSGLGGAYLKGMNYAFTKLKADVVFEFDADLSHDPEKIPLMLKKINEGADFVLGSRYMRGGGIPEDWGIHRKFLSIFGNVIIRLILSNFKIRDWTTGYRAIKRKVFEAVGPEMTGQEFSGYTFQVGFLHKTQKKGFKIVEIPFKFRDRTIGKSKIGPEFIINNLVYLIRVRAKEILEHRVFKFVVVGTIGAFTQLITLQIWRTIGIFYQLAFFMSIECSIVVNFTLSNFWTFSDRKLKLRQVPVKFVQFNLAAGGSIVIQQIIALLGEFLIGLKPLFKIPIIGAIFDTGMLYAVIGILVGMFWNFFAYNKFIWKAKKEN